MPIDFNHMHTVVITLRQFGFRHLFCVKLTFSSSSISLFEGNFTSDKSQIAVVV